MKLLVVAHWYITVLEGRNVEALIIDVILLNMDSSFQQLMGFLGLFALQKACHT